MSKLTNLFKRNAYFAITLLICLISLTFAGITLVVFSFGNSANQTSVGYIYLGTYQSDQYASVLEDETSLWMLNASYELVYEDYVLNIPLDLFEFDGVTTLNHLTKNSDNLAYFTISNDNLNLLKQSIVDQFTQTIDDVFDFDMFYQDLYQDMQHLKDLKVYNLSSYLDAGVESTVLASKDLTNITPSDVDHIVSLVTDIPIHKMSRFSILETLETLDLTNEQLSIIASGIQGVVLNTNFDGFVFEQNYTMPAWAVSGQNVRILKVNNFDFTFYNNFDVDYHLSISKVNANTLNFELIGYPYITDYQTVPVFQVTIPFQTIIIENTDINASTPGVIIYETDTEYIYHLFVQSGVQGQVSFFMRTTTQLGKQAVTTRLFDEQILPIPEIYYENIVLK